MIAVVSAGASHGPVGHAGTEAVKGVLFDVDGTLYRQRPVRLAMALELASLPLAGRSPSRAAHVVRCLREYRRAHEELRRLTPQPAAVASVQLRLAADRAGCDVEFVHRTVREWMFERPLKYVRRARRPGVELLLDGLRRKGLQLGVLSDYDARDKIDALGLTGYFSFVCCTTDPAVDALKPDPRGFLHVSAVWGLSPGEMLYVGDRPEVDAAGACAAGLACAIVGRRAGGGAGAGYECTDFRRLAAALAGATA